ncbi:MAG: HAD-IB family hydrolase [Steroidobacteraceae bacterium]
MPPRRLVLFDLDGTITRHDSFPPFVWGLVARHPLRWLRLPLLGLPFAAFTLRLIGRGTLKGSLLRLMLGGLPRSAVADWVRDYASQVVPARLFSEAVAAFQQHLRAGDHVVVVSASPDLYVPEIARLLGAHEVFCTPIRWRDGRLDGRLAGPNCRDHEKDRVLQQLRRAHPGLPVIAYGNSVEDLIHMQHCEQAVYVNPTPRMQAMLERMGIPGVFWR